MKKLIIVNWRWEKLNKENKSHLKIDVNEMHKIVYSRQADEHDFNSLLESLLSEFGKDDECLILTHYNETSQIISIPEDFILLPKEFKGTSKIHEFSGGSDRVYYGESNRKGLFNPADETIKTENFDYIWDYYWNQLELDYPKKKLINTFLPLAIDMQGLSQMSNNEKREQYREEIIQDINLNGDEIIKEWSEIKNVLAIDSTQDVLSEKYRLNQKQKNKIKFPIEGGNTSISKKELIKLFEKDSCDKDEFLPKWLEKAVKILDDKIAGKSNQ